MTKIDTTELVNSFARMKNIPVKTVMRNAARDFVRTAQRETPLSVETKARYYRAKLDDRRWWIPVDLIGGRKIHNKPGRTQLKRWLNRGWSKATWIGSMRALGMSSQHPAKRLPAVVTHQSIAYQKGPDRNPQAVVEDVLALDNFGRGTSDEQHRRISAEGFKVAARNMMKEYNRLVRRAWHR